MKKAVLFIRVSTVKQDYERQKDLLLPLIKSDGYSLKDIAFIEYKESAIKNDTQNRKSLDELKSVIEENEIRNVYVTEISRLARRDDVMYDVLALLERKEISLVVQSPQLIRTYEWVNGEWTKNHIADVIIAFMRHLATTEMTVKLDRLMSGKERKKKEGRIVCSTVKFGYDKVDKRPVINKKQAAIVIKMFNEYASGKSTGLIWEDIKNLGYFKVNDRVRASGNKKVYNILTDTTYIGKNHKTKYDAIVDEKLFNKVQELLKDKNPSKNKTKYIYYCQGLIKYKGRTMTPNAADVVYYIQTKEEYAALNINVLDSLTKTMAAEALTLSSSNNRTKKKKEFRNRMIQLSKEIHNIHDTINEKYKEKERNEFMFLKANRDEKQFLFEDKRIAEEIEYLNKEISQKKVAVLEIEEYLNTTNIDYIDDTKQLNNLLDMTDDQEIYNYIHSVIEAINVNRIDKNTYEIRYDYKDKAIPYEAYYRYVRKGCKIKLYQVIGDTYDDWSDTWEKRFIKRNTIK